MNTNVLGKLQETCRIALMSYPDAIGVVRKPIIAASWDHVLRSISLAIKYCVRHRGESAVEFVRCGFSVLVVAAAALADCEQLLMVIP